jgi:hypothetical protein
MELLYVSYFRPKRFMNFLVPASQFSASCVLHRWQWNLRIIAFLETLHLFITEIPTFGVNTRQGGD